MKSLTFYINEDEYFKGGKADNLSLEDIAKKHNIDITELQKELEKGIKVELEHTDDEKKAEEIAKDHLFEFPDYYTRLLDMEKDIEDEENPSISVTIDMDESELYEMRIRMNPKQKNSSKVVRETTEYLFGKEGIHRPLIDKIFKIFKTELRIKSKELGVQFGQVRTWKIVLRDHDNIPNREK